MYKQAKARWRKMAMRGPRKFRRRFRPRVTDPHSHDFPRCPRRNPRGPGGLVIMCTTCDSVEHLRHDCPRTRALQRATVPQPRAPESEDMTLFRATVATASTFNEPGGPTVSVTATTAQTAPPLPLMAPPLKAPPSRPPESSAPVGARTSLPWPPPVKEPPVRTLPNRQDLAPSNSSSLYPVAASS